MSQSMNAEYITWDEVEKFVKDVKAFCIPRKINGIYGIPRGGNVLATMISYSTGLPLLQAPTKGCIVVDDISDTGETLAHYDRKGYWIVTMCYKKTSKVRPSLFLKETEGWVVFPWEGGYDESK